MENKWMKPSTIEAVEMAFPTGTSEFLPAMVDIPEEFKRRRTKWNKVFDHWFFVGMSGAIFTEKPGIDKGLAISHLYYVMRSFEPKHEHKEAGVAYLMSLWFDDIECPGL